MRGVLLVGLVVVLCSCTQAVAQVPSTWQVRIGATGDLSRANGQTVIVPVSARGQQLYGAADVIVGGQKVAGVYVLSGVGGSMTVGIGSYGGASIGARGSAPQAAVMTPVRVSGHAGPGTGTAFGAAVTPLP